MNDNIPIKVSTGSKMNHQDIKKALNLNKAISDAKHQVSSSAKKATVWKVLTALLLLLSIALATKTFWLDQRSFSDYQNIIPSQTQAVFFIKISQLSELAPSVIPGLEQNSDYYKWLKQRITQFLADADINAQAELIPSLGQEAAVMVFPKNSTGRLNWAIITQSDLEQNAASQTVFDKIEQGLRKNFGMNQLLYRQIQIKTVYAFNKIDQPYYYSQIDNYMIVGNDLDSFEKIIDKIIGN